MRRAVVVAVVGHVVGQRAHGGNGVAHGHGKTGGAHQLQIVSAVGHGQRPGNIDVQRAAERPQTAALVHACRRKLQAQADGLGHGQRMPLQQPQHFGALVGVGEIEVDLARRLLAAQQPAGNIRLEDRTLLEHAAEKRHAMALIIDFVLFAADD